MELLLANVKSDLMAREQDRMILEELLNHVLNWSYHKLRGFHSFQLGMSKKPFRKLFAFVGVTREAFCLCIPLMTG